MSGELTGAKQGRVYDNRNWKHFRSARGKIRWFQRFYEAALIISGRHSLHRAWQLGLDQGSNMAYQRLITNKGYLGEVAYAEKRCLAALLRSGG